MGVDLPHGRIRFRDPDASRPRVPAKDLRSIMVYTRSMIQTDQGIAGLESYGSLKTNADGSIDLYYSPEAPDGKASNWVKTRGGRGFFVLFRAHGLHRLSFDQSWALERHRKRDRWRRTQEDL